MTSRWCVASHTHTHTHTRDAHHAHARKWQVEGVTYEWHLVWVTPTGKKEEVNGKPIAVDEIELRGCVLLCDSPADCFRSRDIPGFTYTQHWINLDQIVAKVARGAAH